MSEFKVSRRSDTTPEVWHHDFVVDAVSAERGWADELSGMHVRRHVLGFARQGGAL